MENENEVNLIEEVDQELRILNTPVKDRKTNNSQGCLSTPQDITKKQFDFKINISRIENQKRSFQDYKSSPSASINQILDRSANDIYGLKSSLSSNEFLQMQSMEQLCGYHQKPLDVVCIRDLTLICSNCALFGVHKGHDFKSLAEVNRDKNKIQNSIQKIIQSKHEVQDLLRNGQDQQQDIFRICQRKLTLINNARAQYQKLRQILDSSEAELIQLIQEQAATTEQRIKNQNKLLLRPFTSYHTWEHKAVRYLQCLQSQDRFEQQIVMLNYDKSSKVDIVKQGEHVISQINKNISKIKQNKTNAIEQFEIIVDPTIPNKIKGFVTLPSFKSLSSKLVRSTSGSVLLDSKRHCHNRKSIILQDDTFSNNAKKTVNSTIGMGQRKPSYSKLDRSFSKRSGIKSPDFSTSNNTSSSRRLDSKQKRYRHTDDKVNEKFTKVYEAVLYDSTEIVELMHAQLPNKAIAQILKLLCERPKIKILKLNGNKLTDQIAPQLWNSLKYISSLNLSGNQLTDGFVASMSANIPSIRSLKTIVLSQNKINARNVKPFIDQIRKLGITVSI